ncbi:hypothetical protein HGI30_15410 [Paenibacillus albicereus]|uniref:Uncharacterized protein n=1 Tax=Paenibacillus albicereus TaxID=2726185 RepID=A0A6H2H0D8_9BACL|nr:hypothetical protein [Paenibacillus albicereus]QJC52818.1 hypothetical protein HGI30_15410 [Paenibacillus albicereus]
MNRNDHDHNDHDKGLATEKDIDPRHGLFEDQPEGSRVPSAEEELLRTYPSGEGTYGGVQVDRYTVASSEANERLADDIAYAEGPDPGDYARQRDGGDYAVETPVGESPVPGAGLAEADLGLDRTTSKPSADAELDLTDGTPVDPVAPPDEFHGTDLLNGVGSAPQEENR